MYCKPKTIVLDIDGTLTLPKTSKPTDAVCFELMRNVEVNNKIVIATGRPFQTASTVIANIQLPSTTVLTNNGALTIQLPERKIVSYEPINIESVWPVINKIYEYGLCGYVVVCDRKEINENGTDHNICIYDYVRSVNKMKGIETKNVEKNPLHDALDDFLFPLDENSVEKYVTAEILNIHLHPSTVKQRDDWIELLEGVGNGVAIKKSGKTIIEIYNPKVNKGSVLDKLDIKGLVVYIGDSENDIGGIDWAIQHGGYGVAMGNAFEHVKEKANFVTKSVEEDGVAYVLKWIDSQ
ncbi:Haloacid dehalogenase-like hydrolase [Entamoeba marina]